MAMVETARTIYDTHAAVRRLREADLPEPHAEAVVREQVHLIEHDLATKADIAAVQGNIETVKADIEKPRLETGGSIEAFKAELKADIEKLRLETGRNIQSFKADLVKWIVGTNVCSGVVIVVAVKFL